jgi:hypothetical protein
MNGVDRANHIRQSYTIHRPQNYRTWRPQWYWLLDTSATNAYFMTVKPKKDTQHRAHRKFRENLTMQLLSVTDDGPEQAAEQAEAGPQAVPQWRPLGKQSYCRYCLSHKDQAAPRKKRKVLGEDPNAANRASRPYVPQTTSSCACHGIPLCRKSDCWALYHSEIANGDSNSSR